MLKVAIACDHAGYPLKEALLHTHHLRDVAWIDLGSYDDQQVDYPDYAHSLATIIGTDQASLGILVCGSGIGMSIAANRHPHIRAALCSSGLMAKLARQHNDANVLVLGARLIGIEVARDCLTHFVETPFEGGRHQLRLDKLQPV